MTIVLLAQHDNHTLDEQTAKALTAALAMGGEVHVLVAGSGAEAVAAAASRLRGVSKVLLADAPTYANGLAEPLAALLVAISPNYDAFVAAATSTAKNVMPRLAALLDVMQVSEATAVNGPDVFERPIYAGNALQMVQVTDLKKVVTVRSASFPAAEFCETLAPITALEATVNPNLSTFVEERVAHSDRPELAAAKIVVSGGRALGSKEKFDEFVLPFADKLGAAVGASRAAVDAGYAPNDWQVGQTGKVVAPDLYIACGISGAIQHLAGMKDSKIIVAINTDAEAPIFQVADYGLVGDIFTLLPELTEKL
ncbi:electron transfer flavoprotein subunit alpha (plasmid) [Aureimonas sp. SA4125]|uniref:electron transfer flavoprotein subunit alpha/FixB family protein n=1 Tax=Aureimonas sp. SA4125 TaxID=2826993 RepID=UPI001CC6E875|nr:FAD-binding protein [Aureimonas sp. SA4125]BDA87163.1 electron transfer flavoprotein subunit alpha [Aureimonas sp. SA4125]